MKSLTLYSYFLMRTVIAILYGYFISSLLMMMVSPLVALILTLGFWFILGQRLSILLCMWAHGITPNNYKQFLEDIQNERK